MSQVRIPRFIADLPSKEEKVRLMKQYKEWKKNEITKAMLEFYEKELNALILADERETPLSWFQSKWSTVKRLSKRETLRQIIENLKE